MHPYRMQLLIKEFGKDEVINVTQRASLYQTIRRLERAGLIVAQSVRRNQKRPERTVYKLTKTGREITLEWMRQILSTPAREFPEFPAAVSFVALLKPKDALRQLKLRALAIQYEVERIDEQCKLAGAVPRLFLLEMELLRALQVAELTWVLSVVKDLRIGKLTWSKPWLRQVAAKFSPV